MRDFFALNKDFFESDEDVIIDEKIKNWIEEDVKKLSQSLSNYARIRDFIVKRKPFTIESGELTVTLKQKKKTDRRTLPLLDRKIVSKRKCLNSIII